MNQVAQKTAGTETINGIDLYYEVRGNGPAVLLIAGATGDAGHFAEAAGVLAVDHTVITYDRRGNSRSQRLAGPTTLDEQADDASALLRFLGVAPAIVFGTSGGAVIALKLAIRTPEVARHVIVHEPPLMQVLSEAAELGEAFQEQVEQALAARGPRGAMEMFIRENAGSDVFDRIDPALRERMLGNGAWFFGHELPMFVSWVPDAAELASLRVPLRTLAGRDNRGNYHYGAAQWLAAQLGGNLTEIPGAHAPYLAHPREFAAALCPLLSRESAPAQKVSP